MKRWRGAQDPPAELIGDHPQGDDGKACRPLGRILIGEPDPSLARFGGLVVAGELSRQLDLAGRIDHELSWSVAHGR